jgi:glutamyl-tRNA synthetase
VSALNPVVRTRFAPSPTGYMHIGGMRTALFSWLWARHCGGQFILRIDDTDQERNIEAALGPIFRAFRWLGLDWDEGPDVGGPHAPYYQSQRTDRYRAAAQKLLDAGAAYRDFDPPEVVAADRKAAEDAKRPYVTIRRSLDLTPQQIADYVAEGRPHVIRLLVPRDRPVELDDAVRGHVTWDAALMPDPVLMRSNGSALYNFATAVDDAELQITHIIRAEEHLANTPPQLLLHAALGNPRPVFAHLPFITAPGSTKKLSKRDLEKLRKSPQLKRLFDRGDEVFPQLGLGAEVSLSPVMVEYYERLGYLPAGLLNGLARLGWSLDDRTEFFSLSDLVQQFTLDRIVKAPAGFDPEKLASYQAHWMNQLPVADKVAGCAEILAQAAAARPESVWATGPHALPEARKSRLEAVLPRLGDRLRLLTDVLDYPEFFVADDQLTYDDKAFAQRLTNSPVARELLACLLTWLPAREEFSAESLDRELHAWMEAQGQPMNQLVHALRLALTGRSSGIGLFDALSLIGRDGSCVRLARALKRAETPSAAAP